MFVKLYLNTSFKKKELYKRVECFVNICKQNFYPFTDLLTSMNTVLCSLARCPMHNALMSNLPFAKDFYLFLLYFQKWHK
jgi:hypothetical protein